MDALTQSGYAELRGVSRQYINRLTKEGRLQTHGPRKLIDREEADQVLGYAEEQPVPAAKAAASPPPPQRSAQPAPDSAGLNYTAARARSEQAKAEQAEMELARLRGELLPRAMVVEAMSEAGVRIARHLDRLVRDADAIAEVAQKGGPREVRKLLREKIRALRAEIAGEITLPDETGGD